MRTLHLNQIYHLRYTCLLFLVIASTLHAQNKTLRGVVYDNSSNKALPFANVGIPNKGVGVMTNNDGHFHLHLADSCQADSIYFSYIGYKSRALTPAQIKDSPQIGLTPLAVELEAILIHPSKLTPEDFIDSMKTNYTKTHSDSAVHQRCFLHLESHTRFNTLNVQLKKSSVDGFNDNLFTQFNASVPEETYTYKQLLFDTYGNGFKNFKYSMVEGVRMDDDWDIEADLEEELNGLDTTFFERGNHLKVRSGIVPIPTGYKERQKREKERQENKAKEELRISQMDSIQRQSYNDSIKAKQEERKLEKGESMAKWDKQQISRGVSKIEKRITGDNKKDWDFLHKYGKYKYHFSGRIIIDGVPASIITFSPKGGGSFTGKIIISEIDYALIQLEYEYYEGKNGLSFKLPGFTMNESVNTGFIVFEKGIQNYHLKFLNHKNVHEVSGKRPLSIKEKHKKEGQKKRGIKGEITFDTYNSETTQLLVLNHDSISQQSIDNFNEPKAVTIDRIKEYDLQRWDKYAIIPPSENLKKYKKQFE